MRARFRIRTAQGQELSFASEEMFADFVRSGEVSPDDLIYDAATGEWAPARTHTLVFEGGMAQEEEAPVPESHAAEQADEDGLGLDLSLARERTPEEAAAAFVQEMEAERSTEFDRIDPLEGLKMSEGATGIVEGVAEGPHPPPRTLPPPAARSSSGAPLRRKAPREGGSGGRRRLVAFTAIAAAALVVLAGPRLLGLVRNGITDASDPPAGTEPARPIPDTEEALRGRARERFLVAMRRELATLPRIPSIWLDGAYLSAPSGHPEVREVWNQYLTRIRDARAREADFYRDAYLSALDDARVTGSTRTLRLAGAMAAFQGSAPSRAAHYARVEELAIAALQLHDVLSGVEGSIRYEPATGPKLSADPVIEAVGVDDQTQQLLNNALDRVLDALYAQGAGPVDAAGVPAWVYQGLVPTVTN